MGEEYVRISKEWTGGKCLKIHIKYRHTYLPPPHTHCPTYPMLSFLMFLFTRSPLTSFEIPSSVIWHLRRFSSSRFGRELDRWVRGRGRGRMRWIREVEGEGEMGHYNGMLCRTSKSHIKTKSGILVIAQYTQTIGYKDTIIYTVHSKYIAHTYWCFIISLARLLAPSVCSGFPSRLSTFSPSLVRWLSASLRTHGVVISL